MISCRVHILSSFLLSTNTTISRNYRVTRQLLKHKVDKHNSINNNVINKPFEKILIANRGEIACRIIRTCKDLGIKTVAVYSEVDANSKHVREADEKYLIGPAASKDSYLCMDKIIHVAQLSGAQAIHPGYGFLSENAKFADLVESSGLAFIGPSSGPMNAMGDKINSKRIAKAAGCFTIPGYEGEVLDSDHAVTLAKEVGYPVMIKASAGGGGKGMRVAYNDAEVREGFALSKAEALSSFGDDRMLIERFIEDPHHIEIQVLADTHGNVVAFPERECSVQRRNQKVIEESPSCLLTPKTRKLMQEQAIALCKATNYRSAGTVEMLADGKQNFYFLEMNTRLQVEHPVTELVTDEDLVYHMIMIAANRPLPDYLTAQPCLSAKGWSFESRVYAEDPLRSFLPSIGPLVTYREPESSEYKYEGYQTDTRNRSPIVRIDTGVFEGAEISVHYDPMISKLVTHANSREIAIETMERALDSYVIQGLSNNLCFLRSVFRNKVFRKGKYGTKFIAEQYSKGFIGEKLTESETFDLIAVAVGMQVAREQLILTSDHFKQDSSHDYDGQAEKSYVVQVLGPEESELYFVDMVNEDAVIVTIRSDKSNVQDIREIADLDWRIGDAIASAKFRVLNNTNDTDDEIEDPYSYRNTLVQFEGYSSRLGLQLRLSGSQKELVVMSPIQHSLSNHMLPIVAKDVSKYLLCPMPGTLISLNVSEGQFVEAGQQLAIVEAMKMQNVLRAAKSGVVKACRSKPGSHLKVDQIILEFASP